MPSSPPPLPPSLRFLTLFHAQVRVTAVDTSAFVSKGRKQWQSIRAVLETGMKLRATAQRLGLTLQFEYVDTGEANLHQLYEVRGVKQFKAPHLWCEGQPCSSG